MKRFIDRKLLKRLLLSVGACVVVLAVIVLVLNIWQFSARRRISRALQTLQRLEANNATDEQIKSALARLKVDGHRNCSGSSCEYSFVMEHALFRSDTRTGRFFGALVDSRLHGAFEMVGFRPVFLQARLRTMNGRTSGATLMLIVGYAPSLVAEYRRVAFFISYDQNPMLDAHPDFLVGRPILTTPGGGEVILVELTPEAPPEAVDLAWSYDLGCITRWGGCSRADELLPKAAASSYPFQYWDEYRFRGCTIKRLARDSEEVALASVVRVEPYRGDWNSPRQQFVTYKLLEVLKNRSPESPNIERVGLVVQKGSLTADPYSPGLSHELFSPGRTVLLFARHLGEYVDIDPDCGVLPADPEVLAHVHEVVAKEKALD